MSIAPPDSTLSHDVPDPIELLIKEAQRASRRRRLRNGLVLGAVLLFVVGAIAYQIERGRSVTPHIGTGAPKGSQAVAPECSLKQLSVTSNGQAGAGGTDGGVLLFRNVSSHACSLTGYPNVVAIGKTKGSTITATDQLNGMLGGWDWTGNSPAPKPPTVVLANKNEVASDWYQYSENGPAGYTLFHAKTLRVGLSGSRSVVQVNGSVDAAEGKMWVTPFVRGKSGTAEPRAKTSN
jgi:hypothetical protein